MFWIDETWESYESNHEYLIGALNEIKKNERLQELIDDYEKNKENSKFTEEDIRIFEIRWIELPFYDLKKSKAFDKAITIEINFEINNKEDKQKKKIVNNEEREYTEPSKDIKRIFFAALCGENETEIYALNGTSPPIHEMNSKMGGIILKKAGVYLDFFTTFVGSDKGPFLLVKSIDQIIWPDEKYSDQPHFLFIEKQRILKRFKKSNSSGATTFRELEKEIKKIMNSFFEILELKKLRKYWYNHTEYGKIEEDEKSAIDKTIKGAYNYNKSKKSSKHACYFELVQFGRDIFLAGFEIEKSGMVKMMFDKPLSKDFLTHHRNLSMLPIGEWRFIDLVESIEIKSLTFQPFASTLTLFDDSFLKATIPFPSLNIEDYENSMDLDHDIESKPWLFADREVKIKNGYQVSKGLLWEGRKIYGPIIVEGVSFTNELNLSNVNIESSLTFIDCQFIERIAFENSSIGGNLIFKNCTFYGIPDEDEYYEIPDENEDVEEDFFDLSYALLMDGLRLKGNLIIEKSDCYGSITLKNASIEGITKIRGLNLLPLYNFYSEKNVNEEKKISIEIDRRFTKFPSGVGLDMRDSFFGSGLDLSAWFDPSSNTRENIFSLGKKKEEEVEATKVVGLVQIGGSLIKGSLFISGLIITSLNREIFKPHSSSYYQLYLNGTTIEGDLLTWRPGESAKEYYHYLRTYIESHIDLNRIDAKGQIDLRGIWVGGDLNLKHIKCRGDVLLGTSNQYGLDTYKDNWKKYSLKKYDADHALLQFSKSTLAMDGNNDLYLAHFSRTHILGSLNFTGSKIDGTIFFEGTYIANKITFDSGVFGSIISGLSISEIDISNKEECDYLRKKEGCSFTEYIKGQEGTIRIHEYESDDEVSKGLLIQRTETSQIKLSNSIVKGFVDLGGVWIIPHKLDIDSGVSPLKTINNNVDITKEYKDLKGFIKSTILNKTHINKNSYFLNDQIVDVNIDNTQIEGSLKLSNSEYLEELWESIQRDENLNKRYKRIFKDNEKVVEDENSELKKEEFLKKIDEGIDDWKRAYIKGDFKIQNSVINGKVDLTDLHVEGDLTISDVKVSADIITNAVTSKLKEYSTIFYARNVAIEMLRCQGNLYANHMIVRENFSAINTIIDGHAYFYFTDNKDQNKAKIANELNLTGSKFAKLSLWNNDQDIWILERVTSKHLDIWMNESSTGTGSINFRGIKFDRLSINDDDNDIEKIQNFLENMDARKWTLEPYAQVEQHLRLQGRKQEGNRLYNEMQRKWRKKILNNEKFSLKKIKQNFTIKSLLYFPDWCLRWVFHRIFFQGFTNFGSNWRRPLFLGILIFFFSLWLTSSNENWTSYNNKIKIEKVGYRNLTKAFEISIPILSLYNKNSKDLYDLKETECTKLNSIWKDKPIKVRIPPKALAGILSFFGWIFWPAFALTLSGLLRRN
ncbi:hypothetical protein GTQ40_13515 [Flavobacteriaceae bacterium R38]|nr:hypothetical protein [Flavobacteriaceae bacterium R38]